MITDYKDKLSVTIGTRLTLDALETVGYFIAGDGKRVIHYGSFTNRQEVVTAHPLTAFKDRTVWLKALAALGVDPDEDELEPNQLSS